MTASRVDKLLKPINRFIESEVTAGLLLVFCTVVALVWANSPLAGSYHALWHYDLSLSVAGYGISRSLHHWINDGLMAMFFFVVGLELKREFLGGELSTPANAVLPVAAAVGGMVVPALFYLALNPAGDAQAGWGIPMATDIAFALGILALLGERVPFSLKLFLTVLAVADDLGAVLVIAFFYSSDISLTSLGIGALFLMVLLAGNYSGIRTTYFYGIFGIGGLWLAFLLSGVHATIAGVLAALVIPARTKLDEKAFTEELILAVEEFRAIPPNDAPLLEPEQMDSIDKIKCLTLAADTPLQRLEHALHPVVSFAVLPLFALSNAGVTLDFHSLTDVLSPVSVGVAAGLVAGKFIGVAGTCRLAVSFGWAKLPPGITWGQICGVACLAGIGFTMSLFVTNLAFASEQLQTQAKLGILSASVIAGITGFALLRCKLPPKPVLSEG